jgi:S1-C subfamily serine protease
VFGQNLCDQLVALSFRLLGNWGTQVSVVLHGEERQPCCHTHCLFALNTLMQTDAVINAGNSGGE